MPVATKLDSLGLYNDELPSINSHNPLITWLEKVTSNIRSVIYLLQQSLWPPNLARCDLL